MSHQGRARAVVVHSGPRDARKHRDAELNGMQRELLTEVRVQLDLQCITSTLPEGCGRWLLLRLEHRVLPGDVSLAKAELFDELDGLCPLDGAHEQIQIRHGTLAGLIQTARMQGEPLEPDDRNACIPRSAVDRVGQIHEPRVSSRCLRVLTLQELYPIGRPDPYESARKKWCNAVHRSDCTRNAPVLATPIGRCGFRRTKLDCKPFGRAAQRGLHLTKREMPHGLTPSIESVPIGGEALEAGR